MGTSNVEASEDSTAEELCSHLVPIDTASADKPGVVEYDTDIGDDIGKSKYSFKISPIDGVT